MNYLTDTQTPTTDLSFPYSSSWRALCIFSSYRLILAICLLVLFNLDIDIAFFGSNNKTLYFNTVIWLVGFGVFYFILSFSLRRFYYLQLQTQVFVDILLITIMMHASGGATSGLGVLIAVSTSAASLLSRHASALSFSVIASIAVLTEEIYLKQVNPSAAGGMSQVGILSITFMATSLMAYYLAKRSVETEHIAQESIKDLDSMEKLNNEIIQFMSTGVLVIDNDNTIKLINRSAWVDLGMPESTKYRTLEQISTPLARQLSLWRKQTNFRCKTFKNTATGPTLMPTFSAIENTQGTSVIFLEDTTLLNQRAQSLKLASLGRLTASIAHEIRNPLGALSHAAQLMKESETLDAGNLEMLNIVDKNTRRVNDIIENVMKLSQRNSLNSEQINLSEYIPSFVKDYSMGKENDTAIKLLFQSENLLVHFDKSQLTQILTNLIDNGARYSKIKTGEAIVSMMIGKEPHSTTIFIDVIDYGEGIPKGISEKIFEPFYTTSRSGTGLGLYLSKELCEANSARLNHISLLRGGSCFRITFPAKNFAE